MAQHEDASTPEFFSVARIAYDQAIKTGTPVSCYLFHYVGDILFTDENDSYWIRALQAARRARECTSLGRYPRFSHVLLCAMPGLFVESTPIALLRDHDEPAVKAFHAEAMDRRKRSEFRVMRPRALLDNVDLQAKVQERLIYHFERPYHFYRVRNTKDGMYCSQLVATVYAEIGLPLAGRKPEETLPFDLELAVEAGEEWFDVTEIYKLAESLHDLKLIKHENLNLREHFIGRHETAKEFSSALNRLGAAVDATLKSFDEQITRPIKVPAAPLQPAYVANVRELLELLTKYYVPYTNFRRYRFPGAVPEKRRFDSIEPEELVGKLNKVADNQTKVTKSTIGIVLEACKTQYVQFFENARIAEQALTGGAPTEEAKLRQLDELIEAAERREPEAEREAGIALIEETSTLLSEIETTKYSTDVEPEILKGFVLATQMLWVLARHAEGWFYGSELLKMVRDVANEDGSKHSVEMRREIDKMRQSLLELFASRRETFEPWVGVAKAEQSK